MFRFANAIGHTKVNHNPDSWEGWYWGAMHHWGNSLRLGAGEPYGTVEDLLKEAEMVVFWLERSGGDQRDLRRAGRHGATPVAEGARHSDRAHRSVLQSHRRISRWHVDRTAPGDRHRDGARDRAGLDDRRPLRQGFRRDEDPRVRRMARYVMGESDGIPKTPSAATRRRCDSRTTYWRRSRAAAARGTAAVPRASRPAHRRGKARRGRPDPSAPQ